MFGKAPTRTTVVCAPETTGSATTNHKRLVNFGLIPGSGLVSA
jgi:hypothetical protein